MWKINQIDNDSTGLETLFSIDKRVEVSEMAELFLGFWGEKLFFIVIAVSFLINLKSNKFTINQRQTEKTLHIQNSDGN